MDLEGFESSESELHNNNFFDFNAAADGTEAEYNYMDSNSSDMVALKKLKVKVVECDIDKNEPDSLENCDDKRIDVIENGNVLEETNYSEA